MQSSKTYWLVQRTKIICHGLLSIFHMFTFGERQIMQRSVLLCLLSASKRRVKSAVSHLVGLIRTDDCSKWLCNSWGIWGHFTEPGGPNGADTLAISQNENGLTHTSKQSGFMTTWSTKTLKWNEHKVIKCKQGFMCDNIQKCFWSSKKRYTGKTVW